MAGTPSFFAKLFKGRFWRHKKKTSPSRPEESTAPARPRLENHMDKPLKLAEHQRPANKPEPDPYLISFPIEHTIHQLWRLRRDEKGWLPSPEFTLHTGEEQVLSPLEARKEAPRLKASLSAAAQARLAAATPKPQLNQNPEEPPAPVSLDAQAVIYVASDGLSAWVSLFPPVGEGQELAQDALLRALSAAGVTYGGGHRAACPAPQPGEQVFPPVPHCPGPGRCARQGRGNRGFVPPGGHPQAAGRRV